eukprot:GHUV01006258.1.p1 GENE.GHUV01006258.1~~GHUV01006258.1.p1  ORF type:complete len:104 (+),score=7.97 GHUV01006258.1:1209-1520(+)
MADILCMFTSGPPQQQGPAACGLATATLRLVGSSACEQTALCRACTCWVPYVHHWVPYVRLSTLCSVEVHFIESHLLPQTTLSVISGHATACGRNVAFESCSL